MTIADVLDTIVLQGLTVAPRTERQLCHALDEHKTTVSASLRRLVIRRQVDVAPPARPKGVVRWAARPDGLR